MTDAVYRIDLNNLDGGVFNDHFEALEPDLIKNLEDPECNVESKRKMVFILEVFGTKGMPNSYFAKVTSSLKTAPKTRECEALMVANHPLTKKRVFAQEGLQGEMFPEGLREVKG
ncbi:MAG: hypothetical protein GY757_35200 [bacterium]|nr:hypothetical protein [bacterium]